MDALRLLCSSKHTLASAPREEQRHFTRWCKVVDVYDGDTITIAMISKGVVVRRRCRIVGIDAPEMKGAHLQESEKLAAVRARDYLRDELCPRSIFRVKCRGYDKYGRLLVSFSARKGGGDVSRRMIAAGHAYEYHGGTKR